MARWKRGVGGATAGARHAGDRDERVDALAIHRRGAEDVQPVADLHFLQFAEVGVERAQRFAAGVPREPQVAVKTMPLRERNDLLSQIVSPAFVDARGEIVLVDERLQLRQRSVNFGPRHRRREMIDDHRRRSTLRLTALARIVDQKRIDERCRRERDLRPAGLRKTERLARQPFEIAVLAEMHDRVGAERLPYPRVEREVVVWRDEIGIVVGRLRIDGVAALRLDADDDIAEAMDGETERAVGEEWIALGRPPTGGQRGAVGVGQCIEERAIVGERKVDGIIPPPEIASRFRPPLKGEADRVCWAADQPRHERRARLGETRQHVSGGAHRQCHANRALRRVQADTVGDAAIAVGIVGENECDASVGGALRAELHPSSGLSRDEADAIRNRPVRRRRPAVRLERHGAGENAPIDLGQHHVHGEIARRQSPRALTPHSFTGPGQHNLKDRLAGTIEDRSSVTDADLRYGEGRRVEDD